MFRPWKIFLNLRKTNYRPTKYFPTTFSRYSFLTILFIVYGVSFGEIWSGGALEEAFAFAIEWDKAEYQSVTTQMFS